MALGDGYGLPIAASQQIQNAVDIESALALGQDMVMNPTSALNAMVKTTTSAASALLPDVTDETIAEGWTDELREQLEQTLADAGATLDDFQAHTDSHISNIGPRMGTFESDNQLEQTTSPTPQPNVCDRILNFFGSLMGQGAGLLNQLLNAINNLINKIAQGIAALVAAIQAIIAAIANVIAQIINMIASEIAALANAIARAIRFALSSLLSGIGGNSCLTLLLGAIGTAGLIAILARE